MQTGSPGDETRNCSLNACIWKTSLKLDVTLLLTKFASRLTSRGNAGSPVDADQVDDRPSVGADVNLQNLVLRGQQDDSFWRWRLIGQFRWYSGLKRSVQPRDGWLWCKRSHPHHTLPWTRRPILWPSNGSEASPDALQLMQKKKERQSSNVLMEKVVKRKLQAHDQGWL